MTSGWDRKSRNEKSDVLSCFLASTCALTIGVNLSWTPPPDIHAGDACGPDAADLKAVLYLVAINWAQCSGIVVHSVVGPYRLMAFGVCASLAAAVLTSVCPCPGLVEGYVVSALQGCGCASLAVAVPNYVVAKNARGPYRSATMCLIEAFTLVGTLISHASNVLVARERADFVKAGAVFANLLGLLLMSCARHRSSAAPTEYRSLTSRPTATERGDTNSDPETHPNTAPTTLDTIKCLFAEKKHRNSVFTSLVLFVFRDFSGIRVFKKCIRHVFNELNTKCVSLDQFDLLVTSLQLMITMVTVFTVEVYGERRLMSISCLGMLLSMACLELIVWNADSVDVGAVRSVCLMSVMLLYVVFFAHGLSSIPWAIQFETISQKVRNFATGTTISAHFLFLMIAEFSYVDERFVYSEQSTIPFWIMSVCLVQVVFVDHCVLEIESAKPASTLYSSNEP